MADESLGTTVVEYLKGHSEDIAAQAGEYGYLVADGLVSILIGLLAVFLLYRLANRFLYPVVGNRRLLVVACGTLYALVLAATALIILKRMGIDVSSAAALVMLVILVLGVVVYFIIPFLPKLPFVLGNTIVANGEMGVVHAISSFHTTLRKFDGTMVFLPNALVVAGKILNYSYTPSRRIEISLAVGLECDHQAAQQKILEVASAREQVLDDPAPSIYATGAGADGLHLVLYCWVENDHYLGARSELWLELVALCQRDPALSLALPRSEVLLEDGGRGRA